MSIEQFLLFMLTQLEKLHPDWTKEAIEAMLLEKLKAWWTDEYPDYPQPPP